MKTCPIAVHTIKVFDYCFGIGKTPETIRALVVEPLPDELAVFLAINSDTPLLGESAAQFMEKHANEFVRDIGLSTPRCRA
jgi:hypothetical protein